MAGPEGIEHLAARMRQGVADLEPWEHAELHILGVVLRERLGALSLREPEAGAVLLALAQLLVERTPEWGGDARDVVTEVAALGLGLLEDER